MGVYSMAHGLPRRQFMMGMGATIVAVAGAGRPLLAHAAEPDEQWIANHADTRLSGADGGPVAWVPQWTRMRILQWLPKDTLEVWVPRLGLTARVPAAAVGPIPMPSADDLAAELAEPFGPPLIDKVGLPGRVVRGGNLRLWPNAAPDTLLRTLGHNAPIRVISSVEGEAGEPWYQIQGLEAATFEPTTIGYLHNSVVRLPRLPYSVWAPDRADASGKRFEADLHEPALLTAFEDGAPIWSTLTLKGTVSNRTPTGVHHVLWRVPNETMTSERVYPPIPRTAPGGYYLTGVLWTQYFTSDGASIHYNYWSSNWGYSGSHGCLGVAYNEAKFAWSWADVGTPVRVFA